MTRLRSKGVLAAAALVVAVSVACTSSDGGADGAFGPSFREVPCPDDVANVILTFVSCGYLTVLEDRADPEGGTVRLFVTKIEPPDGPIESDPMFTIGYDLASIPSYASIGPLAQRMNRVTYLMDQRGAGHSEPLLECPEVSDLSERMVGARLSDPGARGDLLAAVGRCRARLVEEGVDLSAYTLEQSAADIEDLRRTLDIPSWNIISWGSDSRVIFELLRDFPEGVRSVILHGPEVPQLDPITGAPLQTREAIAEVAAACAEDARCDRAYPEVEEALSRALERLELDPIEVNVDDAKTAIEAGHPIRVVVDGSAFLRVIRNAVSDVDLHRLPEVPRMIYAALHGDVSSIASVLAEDLGTCVGYVSNCTIYPLSHGAYYSALCIDMVGSVDRSTLEASIHGEAGWASAYGENPYLEICDVWDVGGSDPTIAESVTTDVPILIFRGRFDAFSDRTVIDRSTRTLSAAQVIHVPNESHDITRDLECYRTVRRAWLDEPTSPADPWCLGHVPAPEFVIRP